MKLAHLYSVFRKDGKQLLKAINDNPLNGISSADYMFNRVRVITDVLVCDMLHVKQSAASAFQSQQHSCIAPQIGGVEMYHSASFDSGLFPAERNGGKSTCHGRGTDTCGFTDPGYCLLAVQVHLPDVFFCQVTAATEAVSARHALVSLDAFAFTVLLYNGGIACRAFFCS